MEEIAIATPMLTASEKQRDMARVYEAVNAAWGRPRSELPPLTFEEGVKAIKRLWKEATGQKVRPGTKFKQVSGNRHTWRKWHDAGHVWTVNPEKGWWTLVHAISHRAMFDKHPGVKPHDPRQANMERRLIQFVVEHGWLEGKLRKSVKEHPVRSLKEIRQAKVLKRMAAWQSKLRRAQKAIKKLERQARYYEQTSA